jgi:hypothetical protein
MIAVPSGPGKDFEVPVEIIVGTVPLRKQETAASVQVAQPLLAIKEVINKRQTAQRDVASDGY